MIRRRALAQKAGARIDVQFVDFELFDEAKFIRRERTGLLGDQQLKKYPNAPVVEKPYDAKLLIGAIVRALGGR